MPRGAKLGHTMGIPRRYAKRPHRRPNPQDHHRSAQISWSSDHQKLLEEILDNWAVPIDVGKLKESGGRSLVNMTAMSFLLQYLKWLKRRKRNHYPVDFFWCTPYGKAMQWWEQMYGKHFKWETGYAKKIYKDYDDKIKRPSAEDLRDGSEFEASRQENCDGAGI